MYKNILKKQKIIDELQKIKEEEEERTNSKLTIVRLFYSFLIFFCSKKLKTIGN